MLAAMLAGGVGRLGDITVGVVGASVGGWIFPKFGVSAPFTGRPGTIFTAFAGAEVLLSPLHLFFRAARGR